MKAISIAMSSFLVLAASTALAATLHVRAEYPNGDKIDQDTVHSMAGASLFRSKVKEKVCRDKGPGNHVWFYYVGTSKGVKNTARCK
jgi:hypothetical protein